MEVCVRLFLHPPVVHVVVPGSKHHWHNRWIKKSLNITSNARTHIRILNTYSVRPWISWHSHSTLRALVISRSCVRNGNRRPRCPLHCEPRRQSTQQTYFTYLPFEVISTLILTAFEFQAKHKSLTLLFCSQTDFGMNWTGRWVLMSLGEVCILFAASVPLCNFSARPFPVNYRVM